MSPKAPPSCQAQPLINVQSVSQSSAWYQDILSCTSGHGGEEYERLLSDGQLILQLHAWDTDHDHGTFMGEEELPIRGNGMLLWFLVQDFDAAVKRIRNRKAVILKDVCVNPNASHREIWIKDLDGYTVVLASPYEG